MAVGSIAKRMLGFADEVAEGFAKGIGDAGNIRASVNSISSNMTPKQAKVLKNFGKSKGNASKAVNQSLGYAAGTAYHGNRLARPNAGYRTSFASIGRSLRDQGIQNPTLGNRVGDAFGGIKDTYAGVKNGRSVSRALTDAHTNANGQLRMDRVAGSFIAGTAAARVMTGGGLYKDKNGRTNMIGLPFI